MNSLNLNLFYLSANKFIFNQWFTSLQDMYRCIWHQICTAYKNTCTLLHSYFHHHYMIKKYGCRMFQAGYIITSFPKYNLTIPFFRSNVFCVCGSLWLAGWPTGMVYMRPCMVPLKEVKGRRSKTNDITR